MRGPLHIPAPALGVLYRLPAPPEVALDQLQGEMADLAAFQGLVRDGASLYATFSKRPAPATRAAAERRARDHKPRRA